MELKDNQAFWSMTETVNGVTASILSEILVVILEHKAYLHPVDRFDNCVYCASCGDVGDLALHQIKEINKVFKKAESE